MTTPRVPEKAVQAQIVSLLRQLGAEVYVLGTRRPRGDYPGTRQTPGLPDVWAMLRGWAVWIECKADGGRLSPAQEAFRAQCRACGVQHVVGGLDDVLEWLADRGMVSASSLSAERWARVEARRQARAQQEREATHGHHETAPGRP